MYVMFVMYFFFFFKQKTAYEMRISDWSSDVCSSDLNGVGNPVKFFHWPSVPQGTNDVQDVIPVARVSDMLLHPGEPFQFDGQDLTYPDIRLVYWVEIGSASCRERVCQYV